MMIKELLAKSPNYLKDRPFLLVLPLIYFFPDAFPFGVLFMGTSVVTELFNTITTGNLDADTNWDSGTLASNSGAFQVTTTLPYEGAKGVEVTSYLDSCRIVHDSFGDTANGEQTCFVRVKSGTYVNTDQASFRFFDGVPTNQFQVTVFNNNGTWLIRLDNSTDASQTLLNNILLDTWYKVFVNWQSSDHTVAAWAVAATSADGTVGARMGYYLGKTTNPNYLGFQVNVDTTAGNAVYFDSLGYVAPVVNSNFFMFMSPDR